MLATIEADTAKCLDALRSFVGGRDVRLATLGPSGTSSEGAARYLAGQVGDLTQVTLFTTYELASESVLSGEADLLVVANAYRNVDRFYMNAALSFVCPFFFETPLYGIASRAGEQLVAGRSYPVATHPAPSSLLPWFLDGTGVLFEPRYVDSTAAAAQTVQRGDLDLCLTTFTACHLYGLEFRTRTRPIRMLWSLFRRA